MTELKVHASPFMIEPMVHNNENRAQFARRLNLAAEQKGLPSHGRGRVLADVLGVTPKAISKYLNGEAMPKPENMKKLAEFLSCSLVYLQFGEKDTTSSNVEPGPEIKGSYPLISWVAAGAWSDISEIHPSEATLYPCPVSCSDRTFVLRVQGISMEPLFRDGDLIFIDPGADVRHGSYVVARLDDENEATFKQLIIEGGQKYLKPVNPNWPEQIIPINGNCTIVGPVVFSGRVF